MTFESPLDCKEIQPVNPKAISPEYSWEEVWYWSWSFNTLATWCKELTHWKRPWCWERLKVRGEGDDRGWDGWMASLTWWTRVWASSGSWWWTGRPGVLQSMGLQRIGHDWATELNWESKSQKLVEKTVDAPKNKPMAEVYKCKLRLPRKEILDQLIQGTFKVKISKTILVQNQMSSWK